MPRSPAVGDVAPDFTLPGTGGADVSLRSFRGVPVMLVFYPGDDTRVCTMQLNEYNDELAAFDDLGARVVGLSPQSIESHEAFVAKYGFRFPLLADTAKTVGAAYGVLGPLGFYRRSVFVIDRDGVIRYAHRSLTSASFRPADELVEVLGRL
jgi:thioredoxin-dependent peroxiredoxin